MHGLGNSSHVRRGSAGAVALLIVVLTFVVAACANQGAAPAASPVLPTYAPPAGTAAALRAGQDAAAAPAADTASSAAAAPAEQPQAGAATPAAPAPSAATTGRVAGYPAEIAAAEQVAVMAQVSAQVLEVTVEVGDHVHAGDVLVQLDGAALEAQRAQSLASLEAAKSQLDRLQDPAKAQDLAAAQAGVNAAAAAYQRAVNGPTDEEPARRWRSSSRHRRR